MIRVLIFSLCASSLIIFIFIYDSHRLLDEGTPTLSFLLDKIKKKKYQDDYKFSFNLIVANDTTFYY